MAPAMAGAKWPASRYPINGWTPIAVLQPAIPPHSNVKECGIMGQKMTGRRLKESKCARQAQADPGQGNQGPAVVDKHFQEPARFNGHTTLER